MSTTIDQRVVEMRFDNSHFEKNVSTTMSTLDKLKSKLNLSGASKGLTDINAAAKGFGNTGFAGAVDTVTARFSALQVMGVTALANITNSAVNAGKNIVKSLTIDPVKSGFQEYETKMGSIQTILANTEHQGTKMADVTAALEELNLYADKTIYNFQEMTRNIGTFTAAGVDLDTSVRSIKGIANLAAVSGSTSQQASTAMYQLSQALATGTVKLMDWNSVVNAGMGGKVFQNALIQTAAMLDGAAEDVEAWQAKNIDAFGSFRDSLTQGEWLTSEVLTKTLEQFTMAAEVGSETWEKFKKELMDDGYTEKQAESILKMANTATDAATKVKTFTQLMDTLKESAQSGWAQTWETLIGNFEEAKEFFTGLSDLFGGIIGDSANRRNNFLTEVFSSNWSKLTSQINAAGVETEEFEKSLENILGKKKFDGLIEEYGSVEKAARDGAISTDILKKAITGISSETEKLSVSSDKLSRTMWWGHAGEDVKQLQTILKGLGHDLGEEGVDGIIGQHTSKAIREFQKAQGIYVDGIAGPKTIAALKEAAKGIDSVTESVEGQSDELKENVDTWDELLESITKKSGRELLLDSLMNVIKAIVRPMQAISEAFRNTFSIAPEKLYGALEKLEGFTSKFVMGGILDITKWDELTGVLETLGVSTGEFTKKLQETLKDHGIDVAKLRDQYGSLANAFNDGAISIEYIKETLLGFEGISESMLLGGETADKVRRTFEGLFAILDIIATLTGGALKVGFEIITELLSRFDLDILDVTASIGDAIVGFRDFIDSMLNVSGIVDFLLPYVEKMIAGIKDFIDVVKKSDVFADFIDYLKRVCDGFVEMVVFLPKLESFKNLISVFKDCGAAIKDWFEALKTSDNIPEDIISGLVNGLTGGAFKVVAAVIQLGLDIISGICNVLGIHSPSTEMMTVGENAVDGLVIGLQNGASGLWTTIKGIGAKILEWFKSIDFGAIFSIGVAAGLVWVVKMVGDALKILAVPFEGFGSMLEDLGDMFEGIGSKFKAQAWEHRANAIKTFAIAIAILAAAVWGLAQIEDHGKLWSAVSAIGVLAIVVGLMALAVEKLTSSDGFKSLTSGIKLGGLGTTLLGLSVALIAVAYVVKQIKDLSPEQAETAFKGLAVMFGAMTTLVAAIGLLVKGQYAKHVNKVGGLMIKLSLALMLMIGVMKLASKLSESEITAGSAFLMAFMGFTTVFALLGIIPGVDKVGKMMWKLSVAMLLMLGVVKIAGQLGSDSNELNKANWFIGGFLGMVLALQLIALIPGSDMSKLGGTLMGVSTAMLLMIVVAKIIAKMEWSDMGKAAAGIAGLVGIIALMLLVGKIAGKDAPKIAGTLLAMSVAMGILAGIAILMSLMSVEGLAKGLVAVTVLGGIMALMIWAARGVEKCTGELIVMTVAVGLLAGVVAALSLIDPTKLIAPTIAMSVLMGLFALMMRSSKDVKGSIGTLIVLVGAVTILGGLIYLMSGLPVESVIGTAGALSVLLLSIVVSLKLLSTIKGIAAGAFISLGIMVVIVAALAGILGILTALDCAPSIETALAISTLLLAMSAVYAVLGLTGGLASTAIAGAAGMMAVVAIIGRVALAIGALMSLIPADKISEWQTGLQDFMDFITILATGIGDAIGGLVGGILEGVSSGIETFSGSIGKLTEALGPFAEAAKQLDGETMTGVHNLVDLVTAITASDFIERLTHLGGGSSMDTFASQLKSFGAAMKDYAAEVTGLDTGAISASATAAQGLVAVAQAIPGDGLLGLDGVDDFGRNIVTFGKSIKSYAEQVVGLDVAAITASVTAARSLVTIAQSIPDDGFLGLDGIDDFGRNIKTFGSGMKGYSEEVSGINIAAVTSSVAAANGLVTVARLIPSDGTLGMDGIDDFGNNIKSFGSSLAGYSENVAEANFAAVLSSIVAARSITTFIGSLSGLDASGIENFKISSIGTSMKKYASSVSEMDVGSVSSSISMATRLRAFISSLAGLDTSGVGAFKVAINELSGINVTGLVSAFSNVAVELAVIGSRMASSLANGIQSGSSAVTTATNTLANNVLMAINSAVTGAKIAGRTFGMAISDGIRAATSSARASGSTLGSEAASGARGKYSNGYNAGTYLGSGFVNGILAKKNDAWDAGYQLGEQGVLGVLAGLDAHSPSRKGIQAGNWLGEGMVIGIDEMGRAAYRSGYNMGDDAVIGISNSISRISDMISSDIDAQPTIRPVMDLSDVKAGAGAISDMLNSNPIGLMTNVGATSVMMNRRGQNGVNSEVVSAINGLRRDISNMPRESYQINGVTYDDGSNIKNFAAAVVHQARLERRV